MLATALVGVSFGLPLFLYLREGRLEERAKEPQRCRDREILQLHYLPMKSVIIGTAGHIDHGKTSLVKALTGIDADRLEEEKRRGITIDLGFAHMELSVPDLETQGGEADHVPSRQLQEQRALKATTTAGVSERSDRNEAKLRYGFIDVPGHERFVRNMLAGVGGIDMVLLVISADESIKPQTREHFEICRLLSIPRGITVITKSDTVDEDTLNVVRMEVEEFVRGSFLDVGRSPMVAVSAHTGAGLDELKREIVRRRLKSLRATRTRSSACPLIVSLS